jgi:hypothetical protein
MLTIYRSAQGHYYILLIPFLAIITSLTFHSFFHTYKRLFSKNETLKKNFLLAIVVFVLTLPILPQYSKSSSEMVEWFYGTNPFNEAMLVSEKVEALTSPDDHVFIAGSEPEILFFAKRKSPTRFVIVYPLTLNTPFALKYQQETIRELQRRQPEVIVFSRSQYSWLTQKNTPKFIFGYLDQILNKEYDMKGGYHAPTKQWHDTLTKNLYEQSSFVLFKKKPKK